MHQRPPTAGHNPAAVAALDRNAAGVIDRTIAAAHLHDGQDKCTAAGQLAERFLEVQLTHFQLASTLAAFALHVAREPQRTLTAKSDVGPGSPRRARRCELLAAPGRGADVDAAAEQAIEAARRFDGDDQAIATVLLGRFLAWRMPHRRELAFALAALAVHTVRRHEATAPADPGHLQAGFAKLRAALRRVTHPAAVPAPGTPRTAGEGRPA